MQGQHWWGNQHQETRPSKDIGYHQDIRPSKDLGHQEVRQLKDRGHQETRQPSRGGRSSRDPRQRKNRVAQHGRSSWAETSSKKEVVLPEEQEEKTELGFGDLCRFYHRTLRAERDDYTSHNIASSMIEMWKRARYLYADLEEMYLVNMQQHQDRELLARELGSTLNEDGAGLPEGISSTTLVNLTINFFSSETIVKEKLAQYTKKMEALQEEQRLKRIWEDEKREELELKPSKRKMSKFDSLKPISNYLETLMVSHGLSQSKADLLVLDITERFVTAGFGWDKVLQYHGKGEDVFIKKLIPHVFMSKDEFPPSLTSEMVLHQTFEFMEEWKSRLYDMLSFNTAQKPLPPPVFGTTTAEKIEIKQEKMDEKETLAPLLHTNKEEGTEGMENSVEKALLWKVPTSPQPASAYERKNLSPRGTAQHIGESRKNPLRSPEPKPPQRTVLLPRDDGSEHHWSKSGNLKRPTRGTPYKCDRGKPLEDSYYVKGHRGRAEQTQSSGKEHQRRRDRPLKGESSEVPTKKGRDIDARIEPVPKSYLTKSGVNQAEGYLSVEDTDGKTTFYHYTKEEEEELKKKREQRSMSKDSTGSGEDKNGKTSLKTRLGLEKEEVLESAKEEEVSTTAAKDSTASESDSGSEVGKKMSLLEKVREIMKSCVKLKEEKGMSGERLDKANLIIHKAQEKERKLKEKCQRKREVVMQEKSQTEDNEAMEFHVVDKALEDGELNEADKDGSASVIEETLVIGNSNNHRKVTIFKGKTASKTEDCVKDSSSATANKTETISSDTNVSPPRSRSGSKQKTLPERSRSRSRLRSRSRSRSPSFTRRHGRGGGYNRRSSRSRSPPRQFRDRERSNWIAVAPCTLQENVHLQRGVPVVVRIAPKGEFSFPENQNSMVRVTKWTGRDSIANVRIKPQVVVLGDTPNLEIEVEGEGDLQRHDKIACLSILSTSIPPGLFTSSSSSRLEWTDKTNDSDRKWFRVTTVVLHKKGTLGRITIHPGRTMKVIGTVTGPLKKYIGKEVLVSQISGVRDYPVEPQISKICENECIGFNVTNHSSETLVIEKAGQGVACLSLWAIVASSRPDQLIN